MSRGSAGRGSPRRYPRTARVNEVLREVVAEEIERLDDEHLGLLTVTGIHVDPDLRRARVYLASITDEAGEALALHRVRLQAAIARQLRLKRTPELSFHADPAISEGWRVEGILRELHEGTLGEHQE